MNNKRVYYGMLGLVVVLVVVNFGAVYLGNTLLQKKSKELLEVKLDSQVLEGQQDSINQAKQDIDKYSELYKLANAIVPQDKDQAKAVREIVNIASANGVSLSTISFPASTLGQTAAKAKPNSDGSGSSQPVAASPAVTQVTPVDGIKGVASLQINIALDSTKPITYAQLISFLEQLEQNRHTAQVTNVSVTPDVKDRSKLTFNLTLLTYIKI